jgi:hypothetical protein
MAVQCWPHGLWGNSEDWRWVSRRTWTPSAQYKHDEYRCDVLEPQVQKLREHGVYADPE